MRTSLKPTRNSLCICLAFALILPVESLPAQEPTLPASLNIVVVEGEGAINNIRQRVARDPMVRVEDNNHKPIAGAVVVFTLPTEGATGEFGNAGHARARLKPIAPKITTAIAPTTTSSFNFGDILQFRHRTSLFVVIARRSRR